jgi:pyruvate-ferredoxin/flavodoxin oxidoreductase
MSQPKPTVWACLDGNEAAARVAHALSEVIAIYPITPATSMGELADTWSAAGRANLWGAIPEVVEMQSEAGAAGALHGAILKGALATTFTSSQGLLLMLPNMFKIAGELTPAVIHVAARALATHALSIFGDHSDVMAARSTGWAMLCAGSVQEAHDFALVAHAATLRTRIPFMHFFDGFRTSHEVDKIALLGEDDLRALVPEDALLAHRARGLSPDTPTIRGTAQNPDVFFQAREAANRFHDAVPEVVQDAFDTLADRTGRRYNLVDYTGAPDAERVLVIMGSGAGAAAETVDALVRGGARVGLLTVRLYRPFPAAALLGALPATVTRMTVLDRTKEPGSVGEPLYTDVLAALAERGRGEVLVTGARYGLASKEFTPAMVKGVLDELAAPAPRRHVTVGIVDDVTHLSVEPDPAFTVPRAALQAVFFGLGSDGTVGANKASVKLVGDRTALFGQGYFVYDSKKAGSVTVSHLRFSPDPIRSTYLIGDADLVAVHQFWLLRNRRLLDTARHGATVLLNAPHPADTVWGHLPVEVQQEILDKDLTLYVVNATKIAREQKLAGRINTVMQTCFFALTDLLPADRVADILVESAQHAYGRKGPEIVARNVAAIRAALGDLAQVPAPAATVGDLQRLAPLPAQAPEFVHRVIAPILAGDGDQLTVSALPVDGTFPTDTARWEKRGLATEAPVWDPDLCTGCGKCTIVCPHGAIRMKAFDVTDPHLPEDFPSARFSSRELPGHRLSIAVSPLDCTACTLCVETCPAVSKTDPTHKSLLMAPVEGRVELEQRRFAVLDTLRDPDRALLRPGTVRGSQLLPPLFAFSGACAGCGETPYLKLVSQLAGDQLIVANATGCSSIFGGSLPTTPWATDTNGRGPAWANSLFEDNAEFGLGIRLAADRQHAEARRLLAEHAETIGADLSAALLDADRPAGGSGADGNAAAAQALVARLRDRLLELAPPAGTPLAHLQSLSGELAERAVWVVGGDGWAYDIGYGGLDHVLASGRNLNILVLDSEVYSNTGGQASKATPRGAVAKFAAAGKPTAKKDLGRLAQAYGNVYVAQIALGANEMQTVRALREAQAWPGVSLVIAYAGCIEHGIEMASSLDHQKAAVASGYWPLYRFRPDPQQGGGTLTLDSKPPTLPVRDFALRQGRFAQLVRAQPERADQLMQQLQADVDRRWDYYAALAVETSPQRTQPRHPPTATALQ